MGMTSSSERAYRIGIAVALLTSFMTVWSTIVRDDGNGLVFFLIVMAAVVGAFSAWFEASGMARTMIGVAIMQALLGIGVATAPSTASMPGGAPRALLFNAVFAALWLASAGFFRAAAKGDRRAISGA
jgi:predicted membrane channel-forming protein YqfA (hemolysin III family)